VRLANEGGSVGVTQGDGSGWKENSGEEDGLAPDGCVADVGEWMVGIVDDQKRNMAEKSSKIETDRSSSTLAKPPATSRLRRSAVDVCRRQSALECEINKEASQTSATPSC
jgi:hypothetical protein